MVVQLDEHGNPLSWPCRWCSKTKHFSCYRVDRKSVLGYSTFCLECESAGCLEKLHRDSPAEAGARSEQQARGNGLCDALRPARKGWFSV
jgi:hypothetical protein